MSLRTSSFHVLGHVVCGLLILGACEAAHDGTWLIDRDWPPGRVSIYLTMSYSIGQFVAVCTAFAVAKISIVRPSQAQVGAVTPHFAANSGGIRRQLDEPRDVAELWRNLCLGLLIVAAILFGGMLWHGVHANWGQSDWRKLGYGALALVGAAGTLDRYRKSSL